MRGTELDEKRNLAQLVKERKLNMFRHTCTRVDRLVKIIMFGRMNGKSVNERRTLSRVLGDITDWCGMELHQLV